MVVDYDNRQCRIAADMLGTVSKALDSDLVAWLNRADELLGNVDLEEGRTLELSAGDIALAIMMWRDRKVQSLLHKRLYEQLESRIEINDLLIN